MATPTKTKADIATAEPPAEMTLAEALKKIEELQQKNIELEDKYRELRNQGAGYLIRTPNAAYDGTIGDITFVSGLAFVRLTGKYPRYRPETMKPAHLEKLTEEARKAYQEMMKQPDSYFVIREFRSDYPEYEITFYSEEDIALLDGEFDKRKKERVIAEQEIAAAENIKKVSTNMRVRG